MSKERLEQLIGQAITDKSISEDKRQHLYQDHRELWEALQNWRQAHDLDRLPTPYLPNPWQQTQAALAMGKVGPMVSTGWQRR